MVNVGFLIAAVAIGAVALGAVLWNFVRNIAQQNILLSTTLSLIGFILVSTPLWASIGIKGPQWEIRLLREQSEEQMRSYLKLLEAIQKTAPQLRSPDLTEKVDEFRSSLQTLDKIPPTAEAQRARAFDEASRRFRVITPFVNAAVEG